MPDESMVPTLSILIPSYNPGKYLDPALTSVAAQLGTGDEIVVNDAMSDDGSAEVFAEWTGRNPQINVVREPDKGQSDALNRCLARARGQWSLWLNADDIVAAGGLQAIRRALSNAQPADLVIGAHQILRADGSVVDNYLGRPLSTDYLVKHGCAAFSGSIAMRTDLLRAVGGFNVELNTMMDLELQLRLAEAAPEQVVIDDVIGALRFHEVSKSANLWRQFVSESHEVRMAHARTRAERAGASLRTARHLVEVPIFRARLSPAYRRLRKLVGPRQ